MRADSRVTAKFETLEKTVDDLRTEPNNEKLQQWSVSVLALIGMVFGEDSPHYKVLEEGAAKTRVEGRAHPQHLNTAYGAFRAAKADYESGHLSRMRSLVVAEVGDDVLEQAEDLLGHGYKDPACVLARVSLELALKDLCDGEGITHGTLDKMNADLAKADLYNKSMQKQITAWAGRGNDAAHGKWDAYTGDDVKDMIAGVRRFIADYL